MKWAEGAPVLGLRRGLVAAAFILPVVTFGIMAFGTLVGLPGYAWVLPLAVQVAVASTTRAETTRVFLAVSETQGAFLRYGPMLELLEAVGPGSELLERLRERARGGDVSPPVAMRRFQGILSWFELRHNGLIHPFANAFLFWDVHCVLRLEAWQVGAGRHVRIWFEALGELEALSSLASLAHDCPDFAWPNVEEGGAHFEASCLGHPLIEPEQRVVNDVSIPEGGHALLITGSNMSGKSTMLRSIGIAAVMAFAGAPVCARSLRTSPMAVRTSMRVSDSLELGVSHFYAELEKLKAALDATETEQSVLFLLDEILHGTNSRERQIGARWLLSTILERGAIGAVSTHDMNLCRLPDALMTRVRQFHFREDVADGKMTFDYRLRSGPVSGGNALRLMRIVGLPVPEDDGEVPTSEG